jgi:hypothetical protein
MTGGEPPSRVRPAIPPAHLRQEIFALGDRHRGEPLLGALKELRDPSLTRERRQLLGAVVRHLSPEAAAAAPARRRVSLALEKGDWLHIALILGAATWIAVVVTRMAQGG